jgi:hypothetical protein
MAKAKAKSKTSSSPKFQNISVPLGDIAVGSTIEFSIPDADGVEVNAILMQRTQTLATWITSELLGTTVSETIATKGFTVLQVTFIFTSAAVTVLTLDLQLGESEPVQVSVSGKKGDVVRVIADFFVV